jgi:uncharacterized membrane protein
MEPNPRSTAKIAGHPIHPMLVPFPIAFFVGTFASDLAHLKTGSDFWVTASLWLLGAGLAMAALAALAGLTDVLGSAAIRQIKDAWLHAIGNVTAVVFALVNFILRYRGGVPTVSTLELVLSGLVVLILLFTGWKGWELVYRHRVGVADDLSGQG